MFVTGQHPGRSDLRRCGFAQLSRRRGVRSNITVVARFFVASRFHKSHRASLLANQGAAILRTTVDIVWMVRLQNQYPPIYQIIYTLDGPDQPHLRDLLFFCNLKGGKLVRRLWIISRPRPLTPQQTLVVLY